MKIITSDCITAMREMPPDSVDAIVTDPPYGLSFMGKKWDYDVPSVDVWRECLRVLKPGGHLLAFAGTRTQHRMACAIEDAGFEIRDMIAWVYGSGFPKSLDVSKAIDKMDAAQEQMQRRYRFTEWVRLTGVTSRQIDEATGTNMGGHYTTAASQPAIMTREHLESCRHLFGDVPEWVERECDIRSVESRNMAEREVVGKKIVNGEEGTAGGYQNGIASVRGSDVTSKREIDITAPATDAARQWQGWGTALKPALEPITVARKPLIGNVAENVLAHGTGALNVDGCRVAHGGENLGGGGSQDHHEGWGKTLCGKTNSAKAEALGRWPANLIHDGSEEVVGLFPDTGKGNGKGSYSYLGVEYNNKATSMFNGDRPQSPSNYNDTGSAARFFYCAKASKRDRDEGCEGLAVKDVHRYGAGLGEGIDPNAPASNRNHHPTVKPTALMRYLCRLITPPGGTVLDPFMGSGSTGKAAILEGFNFIGIEREAEYAEIARARIEHAERNKAEELPL